MKRLMFIVGVLLAVTACSLLPATSASTVIDSTAVVIQGDSGTVSESPGLFTDVAFWSWVIGGLITLLGFIQRVVPTEGKTKTIISLVTKALEAIAWLIKKIVPDRKKGGGEHENLSENSPFKKVTAS